MQNKIKFIFLLLLSLTPLFWYIRSGGAIINGLDTNFPLDPTTWFVKRLFVWDSSINAGVDQSSGISGIFFHFLQVVPYVLGFSLLLTQILNVIFWFGLIIFSSYLFSTKFISKNYFINLLFVIFYSFNIYLYNTWENIKVANLALYAGIPLFLTILKLSETKFNNKLIIATVISSIITLGIGINPAYFLSLLGILSIYIFAYVFLNYKNKKIIAVLINFSQIIAILFSVSLFWILPLINNLIFTNSIKSISDFGYSNWIDSLSQNTSLFNVIRLQGLWDWYVLNGEGVPIHIPYAQTYFNNPIFIIYSFLIPIGALSSFIFLSKKNKHNYLFFSVILIIGLFLSMGTHSPTGKIFSLLSNILPFLSFFRSPFYIFGPYVSLSIAALLALLAKNIVMKYSSQTKFINVGIMLLIVVHLIYSYPMLNGEIFRPNREDTYYVNYPDYVFETSNWLKESDFIEDRVSIYPDDSLEVFEWGHSNVGSILGLMSDKEFISTSFHGSNQSLNEIILQYYSYLKRGRYKTAEKLMPYLSSDVLMVKNDAKSDVPHLDGSKLNEIFEKEGVGSWDFYKTKLSVDKIYFAEHIYINTSNQNIIDEVAPLLKERSVLLNANDTEVQKAFNKANFSSAYIYKANKKDNKTYELEVLEDANYELAFKKDGLTKIFTISSEKIDFNSVESIQTEEFVIYKLHNLAKGTYIITVDYSDSENMIAISDYDQLSNVLGLNSSQIPKEEKVLVVSNIEKNDQHYEIPLNSFNPLLKYEISMEYKYLSGIPPTMLLIQKTEDRIIQTMPFGLNTLSTWTPLSLALDPNDFVSNLSFQYIVPSGQNVGTSVSYFKEISMKEIYDNQIYLIEEAENTPTVAELNYKKISPVKYKLSTSNLIEPTILVFSENYTSNWKLNSKDEIHFSANGYANAWYLFDNGEYTIYYSNQKYMIYGYFIGVVSIATIFFLNFYLINKQKKRAQKK